MGISFSSKKFRGSGVIPAPLLFPNLVTLSLQGEEIKRKIAHPLRLKNTASILILLFPVLLEDDGVTERSGEDLSGRRGSRRGVFLPSRFSSTLLKYQWWSGVEVMSTSDLSCVAKRAGNDKRARSTGRGERQEVLRKAVPW